MRLLAADIDNDGSVSVAELSALGHASGARNRGWLAVAGRKADGDRDGLLDPGELRLYAQQEAGREVPDREIAQIRGLMQFDLNGDRTVTLTEVRQVIDAAEGISAPEPERTGG